MRGSRHTTPTSALMDLSIHLRTFLNLHLVFIIAAIATTCITRHPPPKPHQFYVEH